MIRWVVAWVAVAGCASPTPIVDAEVVDRTQAGQDLSHVFETLAFFQMHARTPDLGIDGVAVVDGPPELETQLRDGWIEVPASRVRSWDLAHTLCHVLDKKERLSQRYGASLTVSRVPAPRAGTYDVEHGTEAEETFAVLCQGPFPSWRARLDARLCGRPVMGPYETLVAEGAFPKLAPTLGPAVTWAPPKTWLRPPPVAILGLGPDWVWGVSSEPWALLRLDPETGTEIDRLPLPQPTLLAVDGPRAVVGGAERSVLVTGATAVPAPAFAALATSTYVAIPGESDWFAADREGLWRLETTTGTWTREPVPAEARVPMTVKPGPDGPLLASGARAWRWEAGEWVPSFLPVDQGWSSWIEVEGGNAVLAAATGLTVRDAEGVVTVPIGACSGRSATWYAYGDRALSVWQSEVGLWTW